MKYNHKCKNLNKQLIIKYNLKNNNYQIQNN